MGCGPISDWTDLHGSRYRFYRDMLSTNHSSRFNDRTAHVLAPEFERHVLVHPVRQMLIPNLFPGWRLLVVISPALFIDEVVLADEFGKLVHIAHSLPRSFMLGIWFGWALERSIFELEFTYKLRVWLRHFQVRNNGILLLAVTTVEGIKIKRLVSRESSIQTIGAMMPNQILE